MTQEKALQILKTGSNVFLTGKPGAGKTYMINLFTDWLRQRGKAFAVTASTGIAATHINGTTINSWAGIGIKDKLTPAELNGIINNQWIANKIREADVLIIDEISMLKAETLQVIDQVTSGIRDFMDSRPFGGLQVVFVGDFFQLPPISRNGIHQFAFLAEAWKRANVEVCYLHEQHRQNDMIFLEILDAIREGNVTEKHKEILLSNSVAVSDTKLFTHNRDVDYINKMELKKLQTEEVVYTMTESGKEYEIKTLKKYCLSPEILVVKVGAKVMFTKNDFKLGFVNGSIGTVIKIDDTGYPVVELANGRKIAARVMKWTLEVNGYEKAAIYQIPLRLAWAITIHKSQGMSLDNARVCLLSAFEYGQGYVAISRVRSLAGLFIDGMNEKALCVHPDIVAQDKLFLKQSNKHE